MDQSSYANNTSREKAQNQFDLFLDVEWNKFLKLVGASSRIVKKRVLVEQEGRCNKCGLYEWMGQEFTLELEHIDGNHFNNQRGNLECLCPNCHSLTPTWKGRNKLAPGMKVSDSKLLNALKKEPSIRAALISVGLAGKGNNYQRCYDLMSKHGLMSK